MSFTATMLAFKVAATMAQSAIVAKDLEIGSNYELVVIIAIIVFALPSLMEIKGVIGFKDLLMVEDISHATTIVD